MIKQFLLSCLLLGGLNTNAQQKAVTPFTAPLVNKQSILNAKIFLTFPKEAVNNSKATDMMAADPSENNETRIWIDNGPSKILFYAQELHTTANHDLFLKSLQQNDSSYKFTKKVLVDKDGLVSILSTPSIIDSTQKALLISSLLVLTPDNTIFRLDAFINKDAYKQRVKYQQLAAKVFATLAKGTRSVNLTAHKETVAIFGTDKKFEIDLPANYTVTKDAKYDFQVLKFHRYFSIIDTVQVGLTLYIGNHPSYFYNDYGLAEGNAQKINGKFLNKDVSYLQFSEKTKSFYLREQQIPAPEIQAEMIAHVAMMSNAEYMMKELDKIISSIRLIPQ